MIDMINAANPLVGKEIISSTMPSGLQAFLNGTLAVAIIALVASCIRIGLGTMLGGRNAPFRTCLIVATLAGLLCGSYGDQFGVNSIGAAVGITAAIAAVCYFARMQEQRFELRVAMAPELANYLLARFDALDSNGDGNIVRTDLIVALSKGSFYHDDVI